MGLLDRIDGQKKLAQQKEDTASAAEEIKEKAATEETVEDPYLETKRRIHLAIIDEMIAATRRAADDLKKENA